MSGDPFLPPSGLPPLVLLVDDEPDILVALQDLLEDEFRVLSAVSPSDALALLACEPDVAVIVSDQRMPGMTGDVFLRHARAVSPAEALMLTGYADLSAVVAALNDGRISGYVHKPWEPAALLAMIRQAAARSELNAALRAERMLLHGLMDSAGDGLSFKDAAGRFVRLNGVAAARLGHTATACIGQTEPTLAAGLADTVELAAIVAEDEAALSGGAATRSLHPIERDGRQFCMERLRAPLRAPDGTVRALATFERDVTAHRALEDRLRQADRMQALGTMASGVAHDFNNLLTAILGSLELAARAAAPDERLGRLIDTAAAAAERGAALTQRLLSFGRQRDTALLAVDVNELVRAMDDLLARSIDRRGMRVVQALAPVLPPVLVDPAQLELALLNLCINARDAMGEAGIITLGTHAGDADAAAGPVGQVVAGTVPEHGHVVVSVADTGCGMTQAVAGRIFEPFFTTKEVGHGTGLGLSMVYGFMQQSGGAVRLHTAPNEGTRFELCLPVATADVPGA